MTTSYFSTQISSILMPDVVDFLCSPAQEPQRRLAVPAMVKTRFQKHFSQSQSAFGYLRSCARPGRAVTQQPALPVATLEAQVPAASGDGSQGRALPVSAQWFAL